MSDSAELERVVELYLSGQYQRCTDELARLLDDEAPEPFVDPNVIERARLYFASCAVLDNRALKARESLRQALEANPLMQQPDSLTFPPPVIQLFIEIREEFRAKIFEQEQEQVARLMRENEEARRRALARAERERQLVLLATEQPIVVQNSRLVASLPFGVGQYQNGDPTLGHVFLLSELAFAGTAITSGVILLDLYTQSAGREVPDTEKSKFDAAYTFMTIGSWGFLSAMTLGILEAHMSYKPERVVGTRLRPLPPSLAEPGAPAPSETRPASPARSATTSELEVVPYAGPTTSGFQLGVVGVF